MGSNILCYLNSGFDYQQMKTKQVIVVRADLKMRRGKEAAQVSHASMSFITKQLEVVETQDRGYLMDCLISEVAKDWLDNSFTKVCVSVDSEEELDAIYTAAKEAGLEAHMIVDNGTTEFGGVPTKTCVAIGPDLCERIDSITKHLKLR
jgi:peptidyl-tRNA hydrolase, PTH2 family